MVDYAGALKRPFSDLNKLLIYIVLSIIPIVNFIGIGYLIDVAQTSMKKQKRMPEFKDYARLFVEGIKSFIIGFIYILPVVILIAVSSVSMLAAGSHLANKGLLLYSIFTGMGFVVSIFALILMFVLIYIATGAILRYAEKRSFSEAFNFKEIAKKIFTGKFFGGWLFSLVIAGVISFVLELIPLIGVFFGGAVGGIVYMSILGEVYAEA